MVLSRVFFEGVFSDGSSSTVHVAVKSCTVHQGYIFGF